MSLIVNGTTIPTNVANALKVNGISVTADGIMTITTSGMQYVYSKTGIYGSWQTVSPSGIFSGNSLVTNGYAWYGLNVSGSLIRAQFQAYTNWITYTPSTKLFTGSGSSTGFYGSTGMYGGSIGLYTSGGNVAIASYIYIGNYISLT